MIELYAWFGVFALVVFVAGFFLGVLSERSAWITRINDDDHQSTPHFCNGRFLYIMEERHFLREYRRVPIEYPEADFYGDTSKEV